VSFQKKRRLRVCVALVACAARVAAAQEIPAEGKTQSDSTSGGGLHALFTDTGAYFTAPLHWDTGDWLYFGGTLAAVAAAHHYDDAVRRHFTIGPYAGNLTSTNTHDLQDALPAAAAIGLTWLYSGLIRDSNGQRETGEMIEAGLLGSASAFVFKFAIRREGPQDTADSSKFGGGSNTFPSLHASAAFAIGTVLAESGSEDVRWLRRLLGYGVVGGFTAYERLKHNSHWLSDTVAGAGLGIATAHFVMKRHGPRDYYSGLGVVPIEGGAMLTYSTTLTP
jgi:membrane-associated phospholipid phosphatase